MPPPLDRVLIPVFPEKIRGGFNSVWNSELIISNYSQQDVILASGNPYCRVSAGCGDEFIRVAPGVEIRPGGMDDQDKSGIFGQLWVVEKAHADQVNFLLRVWDESRQLDHWGVSIPVVRENEFLSGPVELNGAPTADAFRVTLRVYEPDPTNVAAVRVLISGFHVNEQRAGTEEFEVILGLTGGTDPTIDPLWPSSPAVGQISDIVGKFPDLSLAERLKVRVEPLDPDLRYWAFLTVTHNETQNITVIAPD
ncbi:MAG: hypothetical protein KY432_01355 [Acidobacteria bacterium]|nr:hypothetical protein [Acidobacteriota bacterium]